MIYCQNRLCHYNNTVDRLRAKKSPKPYYVNKVAKDRFGLCCSQNCLYEYLEMYRDTILQAVGQQGKKTRLQTDPTPDQEWLRHPDYHLDYDQGYSEARQRFYSAWLESNRIRD